MLKTTSSARLTSSAGSISFRRAARLADVEEFAAALAQGDDAVYVNFLNDDAATRVRAAYPGATWDRLVEAKRRYDPANLFRLNVNIPPDMT